MLKVIAFHTGIRRNNLEVIGKMKWRGIPKALKLTIFCLLLTIVVLMIIIAIVLWEYPISVGHRIEDFIRVTPVVVDP